MRHSNKLDIISADLSYVSIGAFVLWQSYLMTYRQAISILFSSGLKEILVVGSDVLSVFCSLKSHEELNEESFRF